jgi:aminopeptidase Y
MRARARRGLLAAISAASIMVLPVAFPIPADAETDLRASGRPVKAPPTEPDLGASNRSAKTVAADNATANTTAAGTTAVKRHLEQLQKIADANGGIRAAGTPGYEASVTYVAEALRSAGYQVTVQEFEFSFFRELTDPVFKRVSPETTTYVRNADFRTMTYSGSGDVTAPVQGVDLVLPPTPLPSSTSGCEASDFAGFAKGNIALIQRGTCDFQVKVELAQAAGASAVIIFNEGQSGEGTGDRRRLLAGSVNSIASIPVFGATFAIGEELAAAGTTMTLTTKTESHRNRKTNNVLAESRWGDPGKVVMLGAHLDSVSEGPGVNDNGSGTAGILETALSMSEVQTKNKLRFAFWGAEELGLLGSTHYVANLSPEERAKIKLYLNFDMIASPNYILGIYDGDGSDAPGSTPSPAGSDKIEKFFENHFTTSELPYITTEFNGRSDYGPFIAASIPAGGLFTGAEGIKTAEQAAMFGGTAGAPYDSCYHKACDTITNLSDKALEANTGAIKAAALAYGDSLSLPGTTSVALSAPVVPKPTVSSKPRGGVVSLKLNYPRYVGVLK